MYILCLLILLLLRGDSNAYGQRIIEYDGDTLVALTLENVHTVNSIITEREYLIEEVSVLSELNEVKDTMILELEELVEYGQNIIKTEKEKHSLEIQEQSIALKKEKRKAIFSYSGLSLGLGFLLGIILL